MLYVCNTDLPLLPRSASYEVLLCPSEQSPPKPRTYTCSFCTRSPSWIVLTLPRASPPALFAAKTELNFAGTGSVCHPYLIFLLEIQLPPAPPGDEYISGHSAQEVTVRTVQADTAQVRGLWVLYLAAMQLLELTRRRSLQESYRKSYASRIYS